MDNEPVIEILSSEDSDDNEEDLPLPSASKKFKGAGGAPRSSIVWEHFEYNKSTDSSKCMVKRGDNTICGRVYKKKYPRTLMDHLVSAHPILRFLISKERNSKIKRKMILPQVVPS